MINKENIIKNNKKEFKILDPKNDIVFQMLFSTVNIEITKGLISALIERKITNLELDLNKQLLGEEVDDKIGIVDLRAKIDNDIECEIEMQMLYSKNFIPRLLYYWSKLYSSQLKRGKNYNYLNKTICIAIINEQIPELKNLLAHTKWQIREDRNYRKILTDKLEIHIINIKKAIEEYKNNKENEQLQWMMFFNNPEGREVESIMKENKKIKEAKEKLKDLSKDEKNQRIAELRLKNILDKQDMYETGEIDGINLQKRVTIEEMLKEKEPIEKIMKFTHSTKEEIEKIKEENNL